VGETKYQVKLAIDGKHTVSVASDDPAAVTEGLVWAQETYKKLVRLRHGEAGQAGAQVVDQGGNDEDEPGVPPQCGIHGGAMDWVDKNGGFWSCHRRNDDGSWCKYRPPKAS
jgi:hypothetical protein